MFIGTMTLFIVGWAMWSIWSKLCDIEQRQCRIQEEMSLSLKEIETQIDLLQSSVRRIEYGEDYDDIDRLR